MSKLPQLTDDERRALIYIAQSLLRGDGYPHVLIDVDRSALRKMVAAIGGPAREREFRKTTIHGLAGMPSPAEWTGRPMERRDEQAG